MGLTDEQYRKVMRKGWNLTPALYERLWTPVLTEYSRGCVERARIRQNDRVLDVASGPGTAALLAAARIGEGGSVLGVDISDRFIEVAGVAAKDLSNVRFERHAMEHLELPDRSFDAAVCVLGLMYAAPVSAALSEIARVLRPGGRFAACVWGRRDRCSFREMFPLLGERLQMDVCPLFFSLGAPGAAVTALESAGFVDAREERVEMTLHWRSEEEACAAVFDGGPGALPFSMFPDEVRRDVNAAFVATLLPHRRVDGFEAPVELVYVSGKRSG